jgi:hypothetical protein
VGTALPGGAPWRRHSKGREPRNSERAAWEGSSYLPLVSGSDRGSTNAERSVGLAQ